MLRCNIQGVDINEFKHSFRETITTVRRLGVRYLWIDCYCILQGTNDEAVADWEYESLSMGRVYANSLLNIGALDSTELTHGLFGSRPLHTTNSRILWSPTRQDGRKVFHITRRDILVDVTLALLKLRSSALMRRGRVIQECVLAPRMLSFGSGEVFWQCSQLAACENYADLD